MAGFKKTMNYLRLSLTAELTNPFRYVIFIVIFFFLWYTTSGVSAWLSSNNDKLNIFELYIFFSNGLFTKSVYLIGIAFISCGVFFFGPGSAYYLIRMNKKTWLNSQILYVVISVFVYNLFLFAVFNISSMGMVTFDGSWSKAAFTANTGGALAINVSDIMLMTGSSGLLQYNPNFVGIITFVLLNIEGISSGLLMVFFSMKKKSVYALVIIFGGQLLDYLILNEVPVTNIIARVWKYIMPFKMYNVFTSSLNNYSLSVAYSLVYTIFVMALMICLIRHQSVNLDFVKEE